MSTRYKQKVKEIRNQLFHSGALSQTKPTQCVVPACFKRESSFLQIDSCLQSAGMTTRLPQSLSLLRNDRMDCDSAIRSTVVPYSFDNIL